MNNIQVRATAIGVFNSIERNLGDVFEVEPQDFDSTWMQEAQRPQGEIKSESIKVRATAKGFYGNTQREPGEVFLLVPVVCKAQRVGNTENFFGVNDGNPGGYSNERKTRFIPEIISAEQQFSDLWMEVVSEDVPLTLPKKSTLLTGE